MRAPCPGLWELGPSTLPKLTVSLYVIRHESKDYLKRSEPDAWQRGCWKSSVTARFPLGSIEAGPQHGPSDVPEPPAWQRTPPAALCLGSGGRLRKPSVEHPANLCLLSPGRCRATSQRLMLGASLCLKNRIWHCDSSHMKRKCLKVFAGKLMSPLTGLKQMPWHRITLPLFCVFSFSSRRPASNLKWKILAGDQVFLAMP